MSGYARSRYASGEYITQKMYNDDNGGVVVEAGAGSSESSLPIAVTNMMNSTMQDTKRYYAIQQEMVGQREMVTESEKEMVSQGLHMLRNYDSILRDKSSIISERGQNGVKLVEAASQVKKIAEEQDNKEQMYHLVFLAVLVPTLGLVRQRCIRKSERFVLQDIWVCGRFTGSRW